MSSLRALHSCLTCIIGTIIAVTACDGDYAVNPRRVGEDPPPTVRINEIVSAGSANTGWIELYNPTANVVDLSGWTIIDETFFGRAYAFATGTTIARGGFVVVEERSLPFGIDATDDVRLLDRSAVEVDRMLWIAPVSPARCPDGAGGGVAASPTKGVRNSCLD